MKTQGIIRKAMADHMRTVPQLDRQTWTSFGGGNSRCWRIWVGGRRYSEAADQFDWQFAFSEARFHAQSIGGQLHGETVSVGRCQPCRAAIGVVFKRADFRP